MPTVRKQLVDAIHGSGHRVVLAITGGGSQAISELLVVPGASSTVLEAAVPYSTLALAGMLGGECEQACSLKTSRALAMIAFERARKLSASDDSSHLIGLSCTASLSTNRNKRGSRRAFVAFQTEWCTETASIDLNETVEDREVEERIVADIVLNQLSAACGMDQRLDVGLEPERCHVERAVAETEWRALLLRQQKQVLVGQVPRTSENPPLVIFPGAFNPRHDGHLQMADFAARRFSRRIDYELSVANVDKPLLDYSSIANRVAQFKSDENLWLTWAPTFVEKASCFPGAVFVVGADTIERIANVRYYENDTHACAKAIENIVDLGCRFLVFGRVVSGSFWTLSQMNLPRDLMDVCEEVDETAFRNDASSSAIRQSNL